MHGSVVIPNDLVTYSISPILGDNLTFVNGTLTLTPDKYLASKLYTINATYAGMTLSTSVFVEGNNVPVKSAITANSFSSTLPTPFKVDARSYFLRHGDLVMFNLVLTKPVEYDMHYTLAIPSGYRPLADVSDGTTFYASIGSPEQVTHASYLRLTKVGGAYVIDFSQLGAYAAGDQA
jgi:hypothetical protein